jgi:PKD repeat protein
MKAKFTLLLFITLTGKLFCQQAFNCIADEVFQQQMKSNPQYKLNQENLEKETEAFIKQHQQNKGAALPPPLILPIVFHVIHTGGGGNISDAQIIDQVNILNKEFIRMQADTINTPAAFKPLVGKLNVEFRLPTLDPSGNCTNGIDRIYSNLAQCSYTWDDVKALSYWPNNKYINIWLIETMHYPGNMSCNGGGYSSFPGGPNNLDGIVMRSDLIGSIGTALTTSWGNWRGRYLIHELGHWFNLRHIWGDATCGNDFVTDTPPAVTSNSGCPPFPRNPNNSCGANSNGEMFTDYMDYTNGSCLNMFSAGQAVRMDACINSSTSGRNNLWSTTNLNATGTNDPYTYPANCAATPDILPYGPIVACAGDSIQFTDNSYGGVVTSRTWNFFGNPASSLTNSIVKVKYNTPGVYNVALTTSNGLASKTTTFTNKVYVLANTTNTNYVVPFTDSFENATNYNNDWVRVNHDNDTTWRRFTNTAFTGSACVGIKNFDNMAPLRDELISPAYDLSALSTATLNFRLHFTTQTANDYDKLEVFMSTNCGLTWTIKYTRVASVLKTVTGNFTTNHIPPVASSEWRQETITMATNTWGTNPVRFKFKFTSGGGNNIFIDDINIFGATATGINNEVVNENSISVYPNPAQNNLNVQLHLLKNSDVDVTIKDVTGKTVLAKNNKLPKGENKLQLETTHLASGLYFVQINTDGNLITTKKIVISK